MLVTTGRCSAKTVAANGHRSGSKRRTHAKRRTTKKQRSGGQLILLNKPFGYVSQFSGADRNLSQLVPASDVYPAGRLDKDSEGLLLLTDNGSLQHRIAHPSQKLLKTYHVQVEGDITREALDNLRKGVTLKDGLATAVATREIDEPVNLWLRDPPIRSRQSIPTSWLELVINEGRNRQVRRMTAAVNLPTLRLIRYQIGPWVVDGIDCGKFQTTVFESISELSLQMMFDR